MRKKKTVLIVDDHPLFRKGLRSLLASHSGFEVVGEAGTGREALLKAEELRPDLVVMDLSLPDQSGIDVTRSMRCRFSETRIMMLSMHSKIDYITEAFQAGATGYVVKESASERLTECLETVSRGEYFIDASLSHQVAKNLMESGEKDAKITDAGYSLLTSREQQVMRLIAEGLTIKKLPKNFSSAPRPLKTTEPIL